MSKPYKIEYFSEAVVRIVSDIIADNEGHFVVEDLTSIDLQLYAESMEK